MLQSIIDQIDKIKVNRQFGDTAVYKPLLLLIIFNHVLNKGENRFAFVEIKMQLRSNDPILYPLDFVIIKLV